MNTPGIRTNLLPEDFSEHGFGLPKERIQTLQGKPFLVTGAGSGYGQAVTAALALCGSSVILAGRNADKLERTQCLAQDLAPRSQCLAMPMDLTDEESLKDSAMRYLAQSDQPVGFVHCAALPSEPGSAYPLTKGSLQHARATLDINVLAVLNVLRHFFPQPQEIMRVVLYSSTAGWADTAGYGVYNMSKAALNSLGMNLATEYKALWPDTDIQINVLDPGEARSEMNQGSDISPFAAVPMTLALLSQPCNGPNGNHFHRDGRHLTFAFAQPYPAPLW